MAGRAQARAVADSLQNTKLAGIVSSDLSRAQETASIVATRLGVPVVYADASLRERAFGPFEGLTTDECVRLHPEAWRAWREDRLAPAGAEGPAALATRVIAGLRRAALEVARDDAAALVVTHGGALRAAVFEAAGGPPPPIANGAIWRIEWDERVVRAEAVNGRSAQPATP
jgi:probable phosphoglycerate mutase